MQKSTPTSIPDLIARWPTIAQFSVDVGCGYEAARQMRRRGSIAPEHWYRVVSACKKRDIQGVSFEWLASQRSEMAA
ncbi:hypothetical protein GCM10011335_37640 [Aureimonas glaciei]|uniref:Uncharacterized protein n=1 Tax=Aureimonas glaciei TaxID=1776957 RepID=A0A916Y4X0_9HYPH|nr:hypothetical protein GCM10011335_37640 [Aureimonas glaciei]